MKQAEVPLSGEAGEVPLGVETEREVLLGEELLEGEGEAEGEVSLGEVSTAELSDTNLKCRLPGQYKSERQRGSVL